MASKILTRAQAQARKDAAVRFSENVLGDPDKADDIESEDLDDWIERKKITLIDNPRERSLKMANGGIDPRSKSELLDYIDELEAENSDLQDALDAVADIVSAPEEEDEEDSDDDDR